MRIIAELNIGKQVAYDNFNIVIDSILKKYYKESSLRKNILCCCIEIIQNNLIHNIFKEISLKICDNKKGIWIEAIQKNTIEDYNNLEKIITELNSLEKSKLNKLRIENLNKPASSKHTGNGLITCILKSNNPLKIEILKKELSYNIIKIKIFFNHERNN